MSASIAIAPAARRARRWRRVKLAATALAAIGLMLATAVAAWTVSLGPLPLTQARQASTTIVDRNGKLLRAYAMSDGRWRLPVDASTAVDPIYLKLLLAY
jgi:penicillin-binding protein 1C